ncbi:agmatine deiminase family protein [Stieleria sp. JC731]|uniref:agmatine deiminase family protein n=1 Tax=Pirellulaceae TaxID=2691357 RepID=UPI001E5161F5|nr:agmatine deiminase family protein [Stieleria sp. JC731]MCC9602832.1 agmatine deiminase family protein [Stieleria sp. JC731]
MAFLSYALFSNSTSLKQTTQQLDVSEQQLTEVKEQLQSVERQLREANQQLSETDDISLNHITKLFSSQGNLFQILAKQSSPRPEWAYLLREIRRSLLQFVEIKRNRQELPYHFARAHLYLGQVELLRGANDAAMRSIQLSVRLASVLADPNLHATALNSLGCAQTILGDYEAAKVAFDSAIETYPSSHGPTTPLAISLCNLGQIERKLNPSSDAGMMHVRRAVELLRINSKSQTLGITAEMLQDFRMILAEFEWKNGNFEEAIALIESTRQNLNRLLSQLDNQAVNKHVVARNRFIAAIEYTKRNQHELESLAVVDKQTSTETDGRDPIHYHSDRWQWRRLVDNTTDMVSPDLSTSGMMVGEFEHQNGFAIGWGMFDWTHPAAVSLVGHLAERSQLVVVTDNAYSLDDARSTFQRAGISTESVRFQMSDCESPWFRDDGPIIARTKSGDPLWFDSRLTRDKRDDRLVLDALPQEIRRDWQTRVADVPIHVEGGMILSNGQGLVVASKAILENNLEYGFTQQAITDQLRRMTGAKDIAFVDWMIGEKTKHVDIFLTFVDASTVVVGQYDDASNPNAGLLDQIAKQLSHFSVDEKPLHVVRIPMPSTSGQCFPTYTNVVFANGLLLVPSYPDLAKEEQDRAESIYRALLPDWDVAFVDSTQLCPNGGALHCLVSNLGNAKFTPMPTVNN